MIAGMSAQHWPFLALPADGGRLFHPRHPAGMGGVSGHRQYCLSAHVSRRAAVLVVLLVFALNYARVARRSIALRFENSELVDQLREQTGRAAQAARGGRSQSRQLVFLASASHDLRQPMHALGLFLATLKTTRWISASKRCWNISRHRPLPPAKCWTPCWTSPSWKPVSLRPGRARWPAKHSVQAGM
jgi:signal transduction histidine kinase